VREEELRAPGSRWFRSRPAGAKSKVVGALREGLPLVTTSVGVQGLQRRLRSNALAGLVRVRAVLVLAERRRARRSQIASGGRSPAEGLPSAKRAPHLLRCLRRPRPASPFAFPKSSLSKGHLSKANRDAGSSNFI
jgi:hypothetical protein